MGSKVVASDDLFPGQKSRRRFLISSLAGLAAGVAGTAESKERIPADRSLRPLPVFEDWSAMVGLRAEPTATPPFSVMVLNRMGFGPATGDLYAFDALGANNDARLAAYVEQQINWQTINDTAFEARLANLIAPADDQPGYKTLNKTMQQQWTDHHVDGLNRDGPFEDMERLAFLRAAYSKRQLLEFLADFWHNHFNVYGYSYYAESVFTSWDRDVIRPPVAGFPRPAGLTNGHLFGNFRQMLELTSKHASMLYYLDNYVNNRESPNENYAREIIELHTLGAINYAGPHPAQGEITTLVTPDFPGGVNSKYSDADVYEAMYFLTGWKVSDKSASASEPDTGEWHFYENWHDSGQKHFMGLSWPAFSGIGEVYDLLDVLAYHPGTAQHIALKLCRRFISDEPPQSLVDNVAQVFYNNRYQPDQLTQVYRAILLSSEFKDTSSWGSKMKRPFETVVSAMRAGNANFNIMPGDGVSNSFIWRLERSGQLPFHWIPPDGYPDERAFWEGGASLVHTWRTLDWMIAEWDGKPDHLFPIVQITQNGLPQSQQSPNGLVEFWLKQILKWQPGGGWPGTRLHTLLRDFMRERRDDYPAIWPVDLSIHSYDYGGKDPLADNPGPDYWRDRLHAMVLLIFMSPEFMQR